MLCPIIFHHQDESVVHGKGWVRKMNLREGKPGRAQDDNGVPNSPGEGVVFYKEGAERGNTLGKFHNVA